LRNWQKNCKKPGQKAVKPDPPSPAKNTTQKIQTPNKVKNEIDFFEIDQPTTTTSIPSQPAPIKTQPLP
jgi:hypothetical protein